MPKTYIIVVKANRYLLKYVGVCLTLKLGNIKLHHIYEKTMFLVNFTLDG